jgi:CDP-diacylglycerol---glycerol-3-phosphate 3-phosphatidyltransferase
MNLPNILTMSRFVMAFIMVYYIFVDAGSRAHWALAIFVVASITDYVDGYLARTRNQKTVFGSIMDPLADKTLTLCALVSFWKLDLLPGLWVAIVAGRDAVLTAFRFFSLGKGEDASAKSSGKWKTFIQMLYITAVLAYLGARVHLNWDPTWDGPAVQWIRGGMLLIVGLVLWSGVETLQQSRRRR